MIRAFDDRWHWLPGSMSTPSASLMPEGDWFTPELRLPAQNLPKAMLGRVPVKAVEFVGPTPEAIADEAQRYRDSATYREYGTTRVQCYRVYSTLDRQLVAVCIMRSVSPDTGPQDENDVRQIDGGPLPSVRQLILNRIYELLTPPPVDVDIGYCSKCGVLRKDVSGKPITDCVCTAKVKHTESCFYLEVVASPVSAEACEAHDLYACEECDCTCDRAVPQP